MPTRSRRAAAIAAANQLHDAFSLPEASEATEEQQMLARLEAYRRDLAVQFTEHIRKLERRFKKQESSAALKLALSRLSTEKRRMPFLAFLAQDLGIGEDCGAGAGAGAAEAEADENDPISERVKLSMKRKKSAASVASGGKMSGAKRARAKAAMGPGLDTVAEDEAATGKQAATGLAATTRQTRARAALGTPLSATTPLSALRGASSANRAPATRGRGRAVAVAAGAEAQGVRGLGRPLKEGETAFSSVGSPLINPFLLQPKDMRFLKRGEVSQLRKMMARLEDLLHRA